jgi:hypothetical protein
MRVLVGSASRSDLLGSALGHMEDARRMMRTRRLFVVRFQMLVDDGMCDSPRGLGERGQQQRECHSASGQSDHRRTRYPQPRYAHLSIGGLRLEMRRTAMYSLGLALVSACLFGASTPASKLLLGSFEPFQLAGLLYLGAALGMAPLVGLEHRRGARVHFDLANRLRLGSAILGDVTTRHQDNTWAGISPKTRTPRNQGFRGVKW